MATAFKGEKKYIFFIIIGDITNKQYRVWINNLNINENIMLLSKLIARG